jgi:hypothetical protein
VSGTTCVLGARAEACLGVHLQSCTQCRLAWGRGQDHRGTLQGIVEIPLKSGKNQAARSSLRPVTIDELSGCLPTQVE